MKVKNEGAGKQCKKKNEKKEKRKGKEEENTKQSRVGEGLGDW